MNLDRFFCTWIQKVTQTDGPNILRLKGIIAFKGDAERYVVQGVHMIIEGDHQRPGKMAKSMRAAWSSSAASTRPATGWRTVSRPARRLPDADCRSA